MQGMREVLRSTSSEREVLCGDLTQVGLANVLQVAQQERISGWVRAVGRGTITLVHGDVVDARCGGSSAGDALRELLFADHGRFLVVAGEPEPAPPMAGFVLAVIDGCRLREEWERLGPAVLSPIDGASWRPTGGAVDVVMRGLDGRRTLEAIVEECGLTPPQVVDGILEALEFGLVSICGKGARPPARDEASVEAVDAVEPGAPLMDFHECLDRGRDALRRRDFAGAEALFERALALRPGDRIAQQNLRRLAEIRGRLE